MFFKHKINSSEDLKLIVMEYIESMYPINKNADMNTLVKAINDLFQCYSSFFPLTEAFEKEIDLKLKKRFIYHTLAIDGNSIERNDYDLILYKDMVIPEKHLSEHIEVLNQSDAIDYTVSRAKAGRIFDESLFLHLHKIILRMINPESAGAYRRQEDTIVGSSYMPSKPENIKKDIQDVITYYNESINKIHPVILASEVHQRLCFIKPFEDGNGMFARLIMNFIFLQFHFPLINISSAMEGRLEYFEALEKSKENMELFYRFIITRVIKNLSYAIQELVLMLPPQKSINFYNLVGEKLGQDKKSKLIEKISI